MEAVNHASIKNCSFWKKKKKIAVWLHFIYDQYFKS